MQVDYLKVSEDDWYCYRKNTRIPGIVTIDLPGNVTKKLSCKLIEYLVDIHYTDNDHGATVRPRCYLIVAVKFYVESGR